MTDQEAFLAQIEAGPWDDDLARQVYADWLEEHDQPEEASRQRRFVPAMRVIRGWADAAGLSVEEMLTGAKDFLANGEYLSEGSRWDGFHLEDDFWPAYEIVTGETVLEEQRGSFFSCAC